MTETEIQCLKDHIGKLVEIETTFGEERLIARIVFVMHSEEYDEHDLQYQMVSTNIKFYVLHEDAGASFWISTRSSR